MSKATVSNVPAQVRAATQGEDQKVSEFRRKFGQMGGALIGTRLLAKPMGHHDLANPGTRNYSLIIVNEDQGIFTQANVYGGNFGKKYSPEHYTWDLTDERQKKWDKAYQEATPESLDLEDLVVLVDAE